jgi:hypothetical protein
MLMSLRSKWIVDHCSIRILQVSPTVLEAYAIVDPSDRPI